MELLILLAMALGMGFLIPPALSWSRKSVTAERWPRKVITSSSQQSLGNGAYRAGGVRVERVVGSEGGPPRSVVRLGSHGFWSASMMFSGGLLAGAWIPMTLALLRIGDAPLDLSHAYLAAAAITVSWWIAGVSQFHFAWECWEPDLAQARSRARKAFSAVIFASIVSLLAVLLARQSYGLRSSVAPTWFALVLLARAWWARRAVEASAALYTAAAENEQARAAVTGVRVSVDAPEVSDPAMTVALEAEPRAALRRS